MWRDRVGVVDNVLCKRIARMYIDYRGLQLDTILRRDQILVLWSQRIAYSLYFASIPVVPYVSYVGVPGHPDLAMHGLE
jgi:hypothetical protein